MGGRSGDEKNYPIREMQESLKKLDAEARHLKDLGAGIPVLEKNINPIMAFIDILDFHLSDLSYPEDTDS